MVSHFTTIAQNKINGVGPFRIGYTIWEMVDTLEQSTNLTIKSVSENEIIENFKTYSSNTTILLRSNPYIKSKNEYENIHLGFIPDSTEMLYIDYYKIANVPFRNIRLLFYKEKLYSIHSDGDNDITEAMNLKYGKSDIKTFKDTITCRSALAGTYKLVEESYFSTWENSIKDIDVYSVAGRRYDDACEERLISTFDIENTIIKKIIDDKRFQPKPTVDPEKLKDF